MIIAKHNIYLRKEFLERAEILDGFLVGRNDHDGNVAEG